MSQPEVAYKANAIRTTARGVRHVSFPDGQRIEVSYPYYILRGARPAAPAAPLCMVRARLAAASAAVASSSRRRAAGILATAMPRGDVVGVARFVDYENRLCCEARPALQPAAHRWGRRRERPPLPALQIHPLRTPAPLFRRATQACRRAAHARQGASGQRRPRAWRRRSWRRAVRAAGPEGGRARRRWRAGGRRTAATGCCCAARRCAAASSASAAATRSWRRAATARRCAGAGWRRGRGARCAACAARRAWGQRAPRERSQRCLSTWSARAPGTGRLRFGSPVCPGTTAARAAGVACCCFASPIRAVRARQSARTATASASRPRRAQVKPKAKSSFSSLSSAFTSVLSVSSSGRSPPELVPEQQLAACSGNWLSHLDWDGKRCGPDAAVCRCRRSGAARCPCAWPRPAQLARMLGATAAGDAAPVSAAAPSRGS